jgi:anti-sigma factor RsiW
MSETTAHVIGELSSYLDQRLEGADRERVEAHLHECDRCQRHQRELDQLRQMIHAPSSTSQPGTPPSVVHIMDSRRVPARLFGIPMKVLIAAFTALVVTLATRGLRRDKGAPAPVVVQPEATQKKETVNRKPETTKPASTPADEIAGLAATAPQANAAPSSAPPATANATAARRQETNQLPQWGGVVTDVEPGTVVAQNEEEWVTLWKSRHTGISADAPAVDFRQNIVVGVYSTPRPATGASVEITDWQKTDNAYVVRYRETAPAADSEPGVVMAQPFHLRVIPKTDLPVQFQKQ